MSNPISQYIIDQISGGDREDLSDKINRHKEIVNQKSRRDQWIYPPSQQDRQDRPDEKPMFGAPHSNIAAFGDLYSPAGVMFKETKIKTSWEQ